MSGAIDVPYFTARPAGDGAAPGVVVLMEGNGISPQLLRVCQRLAGEGFATVAPDLFWRFGGSDPARAGEHFPALGTADALADIAAAVETLRRQGATRVGITGFCMGGRFSYLAATAGLVDAAVPFYGGGIAAALGQPACPLLAFFGGDDQWIPPADIAAVQAHHPGEVVVYPEAGHGFMRDGSDSYAEAAAADAWPRLLAFLTEHLAAR